MSASSLADNALAPTTPTNATTTRASATAAPAPRILGDRSGGPSRRSAAASRAAPQTSATSVMTLISQSQSTAAWTRYATYAARASGTSGGARPAMPAARGAGGGVGKRVVPLAGGGARPAVTNEHAEHGRERDQREGRAKGEADCRARRDPALGEREADRDDRLRRHEQQHVEREPVSL